MIVAKATMLTLIKIRPPNNIGNPEIDAIVITLIALLLTKQDGKSMYIQGSVSFKILQVFCKTAAGR